MAQDSGVHLRSPRPAQVQQLLLPTAAADGAHLLSSTVTVPGLCSGSQWLIPRMWLYLPLVPAHCSTIFESNWAVNDRKDLFLRFTGEENAVLGS